jgi:protein-S-isoprenylcysteine O-methyltransferase Ste14
LQLLVLFGGESLINLELKIPPVIVTLVVALIMWSISLNFPEVVVSNNLVQYIYIVPVVTGVWFIIVGINSFRKARTTILPMNPEKASTLVTTGVYKMTRNPMYLGALFILIGWGLYLLNIFSCLASVLFILYMSHFQILPEEKVLQLKFDEEFLNYKNNVRRWL